MTAPDSKPPASRFLGHLSLPQLCGQLIVVGYQSAELPDELATDLRAGLRAGVVLFRRNTSTLAQTWTNCRRVLGACDPQLPPLITVDQEGGRVSRLPDPALVLPSMQSLGNLGDIELIERAAEVVGKGLLALGFNCNFAPVLDVDSNPLNPIIGDRSFGRNPDAVTTCALAFVRGLHRGGVLACGKHFPGHGDTSLDSHLELPRVERSLDTLAQVELAPFKEAVASSIDALMTAHVLYSALDPSMPATLSHAILTDLLRNSWGYRGVVISDDLEMGAIRQNYSLESSAVAAIRAGCDIVLICHSTAAASQVLDALVTEAEQDPAFCDRVYESARRSLAMRLRCPPRPVGDLQQAEEYLFGANSREVLARVTAAIAARNTSPTQLT